MDWEAIVSWAKNESLEIKEIERLRVEANTQT